MNRNLSMKKVYKLYKESEEIFTKEKKLSVQSYFLTRMTIYYPEITLKEFDKINWYMFKKTTKEFDEKYNL